MCFCYIIREPRDLQIACVCVDLIIVPSGNLILSGLAAGCLLLTEAPLTMKFAVAPESNIANSGGSVLRLEVFLSLDDRS